MTVIEVINASKKFHRHSGRKLIRERVADLFRTREENFFYALRDVNLRVEQGESVALIGSNGAGKSTMLSMIAGLCNPDSGSVTVNGRVAALLELGSGFHFDLTGRENLMLNAALLGFSEAEARAVTSDIVEFADIGDFIDEHIRTYSSGMVVRLAFSIAVHMDPTVLIVDEVLGVGDAHFQQKCEHRIHELLSRGKTLLCVSHSPTMVVKYCKRAVWLEKGRVILEGDTRSVLEKYQAAASADTPAMV